MKPFFLILTFTFPFFLFAQFDEPNRKDVRPVTAGYYNNPKIIPIGILLTNEKSEDLYLLKDIDTIPRLFFNYPADYKNYSVSYDGTNIAFKKYDDETNYLANYNVKTRKLQKVYMSKNYCSSISFTLDNQIVFSSNNVIFIIDGKDSLKKELEEKILDLSISPDGNKIVIQLQKGKTKIIDSKTFKTIDNLPVYSNNFTWSLDGKKLAFKKDFELHVWDSDSKSEFNIGEGTSPQWSPDSKYIIFQKNTPIEMKFVNADIYISSYDAKEIYQITQTVNIFEMQPIFISEKEILYLTYEDRQIVRAGLRNFKLEDQKVLYKVSK